MIRYALTCDRDHGFDSWFQSADAFDRLSGSGRVACSVCGSPRVTKSLMSPSVRPAPGMDVVPQPRPDLRQPASAMEQAFAALRAQIEKNSEYVGLDFVTEARAIHDGDAPERAIYGEARMEDARKLFEDGVPVAPLPFMPNRRAN